MRIIDRLKNPENKYRPLNYWGWLEDIKPDEVSWQIEEMSKAGLGGFVMHARGGLLIPYMGEAWQESVKAMIDQGKNLGMVTVIDDEDGWPSGFGAGKVTPGGAEYWLKWLECEKIIPESFVPSLCTIGVYLLTKNTAQRIVDYTGLKDMDGEFIHIYYKCSEYYVDNLDPEVVRQFIRVSYEEYYLKYPNEFGKGIKAIFSDEPQLARDHISWSFVLPEEFYRRNGYNLIDVLPYLYFDYEGYEKVRYDFWNLLSTLFSQSYARQIGEWCEEHSIVFTGHTCWEEYFTKQMECSGSTMSFYEYMHIPGIDWLCRIPGDNVAVKQVSSVAQQLGKERILSEMYGCAGWNVSFEELKWIGEGHYVLGVNMMLQHLGLYSLKGSRKREYPASLFFQQPWWKEFKAFNDYFAALSKLMTESEPVIDLLLLHPIRSAWVSYKGNNPQKAEALEKDFKALTENLLRINYDFHFGDEEIISRHGKVERNEFTVGNFSYKAVLIPPSRTLCKSTVELLARFIRNGGFVFSIGQYPDLMDGEPSSKIGELKRKVIMIDHSVSQMENALDRVVKRKIRIMQCNGSVNEDVYCCTRKYKEEIIYFIVNTNKSKSCKVKILLEDENSIFRLDVINCREERITDLEHVCLEPAESVILTSRKSEAKPSAKNSTNCSKENEWETNEAIPLKGEWEQVKTAENAITLDYCRYSIDKGPWEGETPVIFLQEKLLALRRPVDVAMKFKFTVDFDMKGKLYLILEEPDKYDVRINGKKPEDGDEGWWRDKSLRKIAIEKLVKTGENEIVLERYFYCSEKVYRIKNDPGIHEAEANRITVETELESIYLLGGFCVDIDESSVIYTDKRAIFAKKPFLLTAPKEKVCAENLVTKGYPFFSGTLKLSKKFVIKKLWKEKQRVVLKLDRPDAVAVKVFINGHEAGTWLWPPFRADITEFAAEGENVIELELVNSLRNLLGPHHHSMGELYGVGPYSYKDKNNWTDDYCFVRFGTTGAVIEISQEKTADQDRGALKP